MVETPCSTNEAEAQDAAHDYPPESQSLAATSERQDEAPLQEPHDNSSQPPPGQNLQQPRYK